MKTGRIFVWTRAKKIAPGVRLCYYEGVKKTGEGPAVKRNSILLLALVCMLALTACADAVSAPAATPRPSAAGGAAEASSVSGGQPAAQSGTPALLEPDEGLAALLQGDNAALKQMRQGSCYAEITGRGTARVLYFEPFLDVQMIPPEEGNSAAWREGYAEGSCPENPFVDDLPVLELTVEDEIDPLAPAVLEQNSLRQLFETDALITYPLLCEELGQTPELTHSETVYYTAPEQESWPMGSDPGLPITGGDWRADFSVDELRLTVSFIQADGEYVAYSATLSEE